MAFLEGSDDREGLTESDAMSFEGSDDGSLDLEGLMEGFAMCEKKKSSSIGAPLCFCEDSQDSVTANFQNSWGTDGILYELPSELTEACQSESNNKKKAYFCLPRRRANFSKSQSTDNSLYSSNHSPSSSYMGPTPVGPNGKPLKSCLSSYNSLASFIDSDDDSHHAPKPLKRSVSFGQVGFCE